MLLIEKESLISRVLQAELVRRGFKVDVASTSSDAHNRLARIAYKGVVSELILPSDSPSGSGSVVGKTGWNLAGVSLLRRLRSGDFSQVGTARDVPVFVLTCVADEETLKELDSLEVKGLWLKPTGPEIVAEKVKLYFQERKPA